MNFLTCVCFFSYGIILNETPLIIANAIVLAQTGTLTFLKCHYAPHTPIQQEY